MSAQNVQNQNANVDEHSFGGRMGEARNEVMKDYAQYQGYTNIQGSRDAFRKAFEMGIIENEAWMESINDRNLTSHNYDDETVTEILKAIIDTYALLFNDFEKRMLSFCF